MHTSLVVQLCGLFLIATSTCAQTLTVPPGLPGGNSSQGVVFDVTNASASTVHLTGLDLVLTPPGASAVPLELWARSGTAMGFHQSSSGWTLLSSTVLPGPTLGVGVVSPSGLCLAPWALLEIAPGGTVGLYITTTLTQTGVVYTNHSGSVGDVVASDGVLDVKAGYGGTYPFGSQFSPRSWNGVLHYQVGGGLSVPWVQVNQPESSMTLDGIQADACTVPSAQRCAGDPSTLVLESTLGPTVFDLLIQVGEPLLPGGVTPGGQVLNLDVFAGPAAFLSLGGGTSSVFQLSTFPWAAGTSPLAIPLVWPGPVIGHAQAYWFNPAHPDFANLSAPMRFEIGIPGGASGTLPLSDDGSMELDFVDLCLPMMPFYGTFYPSAFVNANGTVSFIQPSNDFTASAPEFVTGMPRIAGLWNDLDPSQGGTVSYSTTASSLTVAFSGVPQVMTTNSNSFNIELNANGTAAITGYAPSTMFQLSNALVGFSSGLGGTDPGSLPGGIDVYRGIGVQTAWQPTDAIYEFHLFFAPPGTWTSFQLNGDGSSWVVN